MGFNQYGTEPALFLTTASTAPPSIYDGKSLQLSSWSQKCDRSWNILAKRKKMLVGNAENFENSLIFKHVLDNETIK